MAQHSSQNTAPQNTGTVRKRILMGVTGIGFLGLMAAGTAALHMRANAEAPLTANPPVTVIADKLTFSETYSVTERFAGRLEPARETRLAFERAGLVEEILVDEGSEVEKGDLIARLDTAKLEAEKNTLAAQRKELLARRGLAAATLTRQEALSKKGWKSEQIYDEARFGLQEIEAAISRIDAAVASLNVDIKKSELRAPFSGTISNRALDEGSIVNPAAVVADLLESAKRQVRIGVSPAVARSLEPGGRQIFQIAGQEYTGVVSAKRLDLDVQTRTVPILFLIEAAHETPFGEIVELIVTRKVTSRGAWLPLGALTEGRKGLWSVLTVVDGADGPVIAREAAEILHISGDKAFVRGTFQPGAKLLTEGVNRVTPGQRVDVAVAG